MVNTHNKGNRYEAEARNSLKDEGYLVEKKNYSRWETKDFWNMFDIIAIHPHEGLVRLVQVKTNPTDFYKARKEVTDWAIKNKLTALNVDCEVWLREPYKGWRKDILVVNTKKMASQDLI